MALAKVLCLLSVFCFFQMNNQCLGFGDIMGSLSSLPNQIIDQTDSAITKIMDTSKTGMDLGIKATTTVGEKGYEQGKKVKDTAFGFAKSAAGGVGGKATAAGKTATDAASKAGSTAASTATSAAASVKSTAEDATKAASEVPDKVTTTASASVKTSA